MAAMILDGTKIAGEIRAELAADIQEMARREFARGWPWCWWETIQRRKFTFAVK